MTRLVIIPLLPFTPKLPLSRFFTETRTRDWTKHWENTLPFAEAGIASWKKWTSLNNVELEVVEKLPSPDECEYSEEQIELLMTFPPDVSRWLLPLAANRKYGDKLQIALIDVDTLILPNAPSIFEQDEKTIDSIHSGADVLLIRDRPDGKWTKSRNKSCEIFAPLFPGVQFNRDLYFNAGVVVLNSPVVRFLPATFLNFVLQHPAELMEKMTGGNGTDQTPLNFILQQLLKDNQITVSFLDSKWNARVNVILGTKNSDKSTWPILAREVVLNNYISHFTLTKDLMPDVWHSLELSPLERSTLL